MEVLEGRSREVPRGPEDWFSGRAWMEDLGTLGTPTPTRILRVSFEPGARTAWHKHPLGQVLHVLSGTAWVQREDEPIREVLTGDSVTIAPNERHWHGASPRGPMSHLAVQATEPESGSETIWEEKVPDADYRAGPRT
jgi:quercetin dioxygenase-like cupin family protein